MSCLNEKHIVRLASKPRLPADERLWRHVEKCSNCREKVDDARLEEDLLRDIRELRERRDMVNPLVESMPATARPIEPKSNDKV